MPYTSVTLTLRTHVAQRLRQILRRRAMTRSEYIRSLIRRDIARSLRSAAPVPQSSSSSSTSYPSSSSPPPAHAPDPA